MPLLLHQIDAGIFTISDVFTREECAELITRAEAIGFEAASVRTDQGPQMMSNIRNNDRANLEDETLAGEMWRRVAEYLPLLDGCKPCGVDANLRFYRYTPGQQFRRHKDGATTNALCQTSKLTYLIYLNDTCSGGATLFREYRDVGGEREKIEHMISPQVGTALLFRHERWHEGSPVTAGMKYVLRSDVFYQSGSHSP